MCQLKRDGFGATYSDEQVLSDIAQNDKVYAIETFSEEEAAEVKEAEYDSPKAQIMVIHVEEDDMSNSK